MSSSGNCLSIQPVNYNALMDYLESSQKANEKKSQDIYNDTEVVDEVLDNEEELDLKSLAETKPSDDHEAVIYPIHIQDNKLKRISINKTTQGGKVLKNINAIVQMKRLGFSDTHICNHFGVGYPAISRVVPKVTNFQGSYRGKLNNMYLPHPRYDDLPEKYLKIRQKKKLYSEDEFYSFICIVLLRYAHFFPTNYPRLNLPPSRFIMSDYKKIKNNVVQLYQWYVNSPHSFIPFVKQLSVVQLNKVLKVTRDQEMHDVSEDEEAITDDDDAELCEEAYAALLSMKAVVQKG